MAAKWQSFGDTTADDARKVFARRGVAPSFAAEIEDVIRRCSPHSRVALGFAYAESQFGQDTDVNPLSNRNILNHRSVADPAWAFGGLPNGAWMKYPNHAQCFYAWKQRLLNPIYKDDVYGPARDGTLLDVIEIYAPRDDGNDPEAYARTVETIVGELRAADGGTQPPPPQPTGKKITYRAILDPNEKIEPTVSQGFGSTEFARSTCEVGSPFYRMYWYGRDGGLDGCSHPAEDWAMPRGTQVYSPVTGTVETAGGRPYYTFYGDGSPGVGQLSIITESGDRLTLGHMMRITVKAGATVKPGDKVGLSGGFNGDHLHVEVQKQMTTYADPRAYDYGTRSVTPPPPLPGVPYWTAVPGLPGGKLGTTYPIRENLIAVDGSQRTGAKARQPRASIEHGTANASNPSAWNEMAYFVGGAEGRGVSVHACGDDKEIVVGLPLDEIGVHAGSADGNARGFATEMIEATSTWNDAKKRSNVIFNCADFMARCAARLGATKPEYHFNYGNGACPAKLQGVTIDGVRAIDVYASIWTASYASEKQRMTGDVTPPPPEPGKPPTPQPPKPNPVPVPIPAAMKRALDKAAAINLPLPVLRERFGTKVEGYAFDVNGQVSLHWLLDGLDDGEYPALDAVKNASDTERYFWFADGTGYYYDGKQINRLRQTGADDPTVFGVKVEADARPATTRNKRKAAKWTTL